MYAADRSDRKPWTVPMLAEAKRDGRRLVMLTAYDAGFARTLDDNGVSFTVSYSVFDSALTSKDIKRTLDLARDMVAMVTNGKLLTDTDISIDKFPGRLVRIEKDKRIWTIHAYIVKERMYQLMTTEPKAKEPNASAAKFFESFQLLHSPD